MSVQHAPIIIVKKKKGGHGGHHGGAWKVAYADFVTAMMAFFLVMWLVNQSPQVKNSVQAYFQDPGVFEYEHGTFAHRRRRRHRRQWLRPGRAATSRRPQPHSSAPPNASRNSIKSIPGFQNLESQIEVKVTAEGLRIELQEGGQSTFFDSGSAHVKAETRQVLAVIGKELSALPQSIAIEGHTDAAPFGRDRAYTNWELSADRANAARRIMEDAGLPATQVKAIRGFADTILRTPGEPFNPRNRRVSIVVQNDKSTRPGKATGTTAGAPDPAGDVSGPRAAAGHEQAPHAPTAPAAPAAPEKATAHGH